MMSPKLSSVLFLLVLSMSYGYGERYCGRNLARAMAMYCSAANIDKRSEGTMYNSIGPYYKSQDKPQYAVLWPHYKAKSFQLPSRGKRFVVDECCNKPCSIEELQSYCD